MSGLIPPSKCAFCYHIHDADDRWNFVFSSFLSFCLLKTFTSVDLSVSMKIITTRHSRLTESELGRLEYPILFSSRSTLRRHNSARARYLSQTFSQKVWPWVVRQQRLPRAVTGGVQPWSDAHPTAAGHIGLQ